MDTEFRLWQARYRTFLLEDPLRHFKHVPHVFLNVGMVLEAVKRVLACDARGYVKQDFFDRLPRKYKRVPKIMSMIGKYLRTPDHKQEEVLCIKHINYYDLKEKVLRKNFVGSTKKDFTLAFLEHDYPLFYHVDEICETFSKCTPVIGALIESLLRNGQPVSIKKKHMPEKLMEKYGSLCCV